MAHHPVVEFSKKDEDNMSNYIYSIVLKSRSDKVNAAYMTINRICICENDYSLEFIRTYIPFSFIVGLGDLDLAKYMISRGVDASTYHGALNTACYQQNLKMTELLLQNNIDISTLDDHHYSPLMTLFEWVDDSSDLTNIYRITKLLVSYGVKIPPHDIYIMAQAVKLANLDTVRLLVNEANGNLNFRFEENSCLHLAVHNKEPGVLEFVIEAFKRQNMNIDLRYGFGDTPLLLASNLAKTSNCNTAIKTLLKSGADVNIKNVRGLTSLDLLMTSKSKRDPELAWLYFDLGFDILEGSNLVALNCVVGANNPWMKDIIAEIAKKVTMGSSIIRETLYLCDEAVRHLNLCKKQLAEMQKIKFYKNVTFWDVLTADQTKMMKYAENSVLVKSFFDSNCNRTFSVYCARIRQKFMNVMSRNSLIDLATGVICRTIKCPEMYEIFQHELMTYMKKEDFVKQLGCCNLVSE